MNFSKRRIYELSPLFFLTQKLCLSIGSKWQSIIGRIRNVLRTLNVGKTRSTPASEIIQLKCKDFQECINACPLEAVLYGPPAKNVAVQQGVPSC